jgi:hypothetical protein
MKKERKKKRIEMYNERIRAWLTTMLTTHYDSNARLMAQEFDVEYRNLYNFAKDKGDTINSIDFIQILRKNPTEIIKLLDVKISENQPVHYPAPPTTLPLAHEQPESLPELRAIIRTQRDEIIYLRNLVNNYIAWAQKQINADK